MPARIKGEEGNMSAEAVAESRTEWIEVGRLEEIPPLGARVVRAPGGDIAVFRNAEDEVFALRNRCPHKGGPLSEGIVYGRTVACPLHNWCMSLDSGRALAPDEGCAPAYPVRVLDGLVFLGLTPAGPCG
jgi:nitrite reductase (NADH) small subunit